MAWKIDVLKSEGIVRVVLLGYLNLENASKLVLELLYHANEIGINNFLVDLRAVHVKATNIEIYWSPTLFAELGLTRNKRVALIPPVTPNSAEKVSFYETVSQNSGYLVRIFQEHHSAQEWLMNGC